MKIVKGVYFFQSGENTYLRNVNDFKDYLFNEIVFDILDFIKKSSECNLEKLCKHLMTIYDIENENEFKNDIFLFVQELYEYGIIINNEIDSETHELPISDLVAEERANNMQLNTVALELTYRCNEKCIHCYVDDCPITSEDELSFEEYKSVLFQLKELGCINLLLTGGEVCLKSDFIEIARYATSLGFLVDVFTNGIAMTDEQFDALCDMKVNSVSFSLYGSEPSIHDAITKVPGSFDLTLKRAMMFKCAGVDTYIKNVVMKQNLDDLENLYRLGKRIGIDVKTATNISNTHTGVSAQPYRLETQEQRSKAMYLINKYDSPIEIDSERNMNDSICSAASNSLSIDPYGGVHPCLAFTTSAGSVRESSIKDIWENSSFMNEVRALKFKDLNEKCSTCKHSNYCSVCIGAAYEEFNKTFCFNVDTCKWAEITEEIYNINR